MRFQTVPHLSALPQSGVHRLARASRELRCPFNDIPSQSPVNPGLPRPGTFHPRPFSALGGLRLCDGCLPCFMQAPFMGFVQESSACEQSGVGALERASKGGESRHGRARVRIGHTNHSPSARRRVGSGCRRPRSFAMSPLDDVATEQSAAPSKPPGMSTSIAHRAIPSEDSVTPMSTSASH
jgi:hypothetical protein